MILRYRTVRFVPDPIRDEVINIGLLMGETGGEWFRARFLRNYGKVAAVGGRGAVAYAKAVVRDLESEIPMDGRQRRLFPPRSSLNRLLSDVPEAESAIRLGEVLNAVDDDPEALFEDLFGQLVGSSRLARAISDATAHTRDQLKRQFRLYATSWDLLPEQLGEEGVQGSFRHPVDFGLYNGHLKAVVHTVSFQGDLDWAGYQRAILSEAALDLRNVGQENVAFAMLFAPAANGNREAQELERTSVEFLQSFGVHAVPFERIDSLQEIVARARDRWPIQ